MSKFRGLFIVGCPRSGTTLLQSLLACAPDVATFRETRLFTSTLVKRKGFFLPSRSPRQEASRFLSENELDPKGLPTTRPGIMPTSRSAWILSVLDAAAAQRNGTIWLEKTPRHLQYLPIIANGAAQRSQRIDFVHLVRDGIATSASLVQASKLNPKTWRRVYTPEQALQRWQGDLAISRSYIGAAGHHFACYEDLTEDPEGSVKRLAKALDLTITASDLEKRQEKAANVIRPDEKWKSLNTGKIVKTNRTNQHLTQEEIDELERQIHRGNYESLRQAALA